MHMVYAFLDLTETPSADRRLVISPVVRYMYSKSFIASTGFAVGFIEQTTLKCNKSKRVWIAREL